MTNVAVGVTRNFREGLMRTPESRHGDMADQANPEHEAYIASSVAPILGQKRWEEGVLGSFGGFVPTRGRKCKDCGEEISKIRLQALPLTRICIKCKEAQKP